jgi:DNA polymerase
VGGFQEDQGVAHYEICRTCYGSGNYGKEQLTYEGTNQYTRKWEEIETYYGKLVENIVQKVARDVFKHGVKLACAAGYDLVIPVHDEAVTEVPDDPAYTAEGLSSYLCRNPPWALGLPLAAAGHEMYRYAKLD